MEVKIGIQSVPRELVVETDTPADEIEQQLVEVLARGEHSVFSLSMSKGGKMLVPADKLRTLLGLSTVTVAQGNKPHAIIDKTLAG